MLVFSTPFFFLRDMALLAMHFKKRRFPEKMMKYSIAAILILSGLICYGLSNFISNSATAALLMPILAVVCTAMGDKLDAIGGTATVLIGVAIASSSAMILPISTPPNALAYATNLVQQKDMAKIGIIVGVISIVLGYAFLYVFGSMHLL